MVGHLHRVGIGVAGGQEVNIVDQEDGRSQAQHRVLGPLGQGVSVSPVGQPVEPADRRVQPADMSVAGQRDIDDRDPAVPLGSGLAAQRDLGPPELAAVLADRGALAQPRVGVHQGGGLGLVPVVPVGLHDLGQVTVQSQQLGCLDRADVGVPHRPPVVVTHQLRPGQRGGRRFGHPLGAGAVRAGDELQPAAQPGRRVLPVIPLEHIRARGLDGDGGHRVSQAPA